MPKIAAANNLNIELEPTQRRWKLYTGQIEEGNEPFVDAGVEGITYQPAFGNSRRLPPGGIVHTEQIAMVVVGWAVEDSSWHLGVLFKGDLVQQRGGRWCGLTRWDDVDSDLAERAGLGLAEAMHIPFKLVPPTEKFSMIAEPPRDAQDTPYYAQAAAGDVPLLPLPIDLGEWTVQEDTTGILWERSKAWRSAILMRLIFFGMLAPIFGALSIGALASPFARVQPEWLPFVGLAVAIVLLLSAIWQWRLLTQVTARMIDRRARMIRLMKRNHHIALQSPFEGVEYLLVSHVTARRKSENSPTSYEHLWAEAWVHLFSPRRGFIDLCYVSNLEGRVQVGVNFAERRPLSLAEINTPVHHAALITAKEIGIPILVEERR